MGIISKRQVQLSSVTQSWLPCPSLNTQSLLKLTSVESWCHPTSSPSVVSFSSCLQPFPASSVFQWVSSSYQVAKSIRVLGLASVLPMNTQDWSLGWTGWISMQFMGLSSLLQHHSSKASILWCSVFFIVQLSHPYMTNEKTSFD